MTGGLTSLFLLHGEAPAAFVWPSWDTPPSVALGVLVWLGGYLYVTGPLRRRLGISRPDDQTARTIRFVLGLVAMFVALTGPVHELSDFFLFSAHMVQVMLMTMIMPPLLISGVPRWVVEKALESPPVAAVARVLTRPGVAAALFLVTLAAWHVPAFFDHIIAYRPIHVAGHLALMTTGVIVWWPVLSPYEEHRLSYGMQMVYLFLLGLVMKLIGALITLSTDVVYRVYPAGVRPFGLTPIQDQKWGGLIMWVLMGVTAWVVMSIIFFKWYAEESGPDVAPGGPAPLQAAGSREGASA
ncbi:MAG: cytochrome c oxidase assembly protein [Candidatus Palauibacterales bacterium]|nr:cytochrome c oxidase assembly protein [Candidatus Palauibacterales bacterium]MDP2528836.1 cytochrome c oxidase assembly protein [Candidatus Palauibacterales bacterium]